MLVESQTLGLDGANGKIPLRERTVLSILRILDKIVVVRRPQM